MGFQGDVDLVATGATGWTATLADAKLTLQADGTATTTVKLSALGDVDTLAGDLKITATSAAGTIDATVGVTFNPVLAVTFQDNGAGKCLYPINRNINNPWLLKAGRTIKVINGSPNLPFRIHVDQIAGWNHQNGTSPAGGSYSGTLTAAGDVTQFYCHNDANAITMKEDGMVSGMRNYVRVVQ